MILNNSAGNIGISVCGLACVSPANNLLNMNHVTSTEKAHNMRME